MAARFFCSVCFAALIALAAPLSAGAAETEAASTPEPPRVTHTIDGYKITRDRNDCLTCHAAPANEKAGARAATDSHYVHRDGERLEKILATRAFCTQCHTPGADAKPLPGGRP